MMTAAFIAITAWSTFVLTTAMQYGRRPRRLHRWARVVAIAGVALCLPVLLLGSYGVPDGWSFHWLGFAASLGSIGLPAAIGGAGLWLVADTAFVWTHRRRVFPFMFRADPTGNPVSEPSAPR